MAKKPVHNLFPTPASPLLHYIVVWRGRPRKAHVIINSMIFSSQATNYQLLQRAYYINSWRPILFSCSGAGMDNITYASVYNRLRLQEADGNKNGQELYSWRPRVTLVRRWT